MQLFYVLIIFMTIWTVKVEWILGLVIVGLEIQFGWKEEQI